MISKFIDYTYQIFPSIDTNTKNGIKQLIEQFDTKKPNWYSNNLENLSQGDILDNIVFTYINNSGDEITYKTKGVILSNTCDLSRDKFIIIAPFIPFNNEFSPEKQKSIKNNIVSGTMCLTNSDLDNFYIDFSRINSFNRNIVLNLFNNDKIQRVHSLSQFGFYFLCSKIAVYYLRVEDYKNFDSRSDKMFLEV